MKSYYAKTTINYLDKSVDETQPYEGSYGESFVVNSKTELIAINKVFEQAYKGFREIHNEECNILKSFHIHVFHENPDDKYLS